MEHQISTKKLRKQFSKNAYSFPTNKPNTLKKNNSRNKSLQEQDIMKHLCSKNLKKKRKKIKYTLDAMKETMRPSPMELDFKKKSLSQPQIFEASLNNFKCTRCNWDYIKDIKMGKSISVHPFLDVLMCSKCVEFYGDGDFSTDSEGEDKYCRWCGEGGIISFCSKCTNGFCNVCLKKNLGISFLKKVENDVNWLCLICNPKPLWELRFICSMVKHISKTSENEATAEKNKRGHPSSFLKRSQESFLADSDLENLKTNQTEIDNSKSNAVTFSVAKKKRLAIQNNRPTIPNKKNKRKLKEDSESSSSEDSDFEPFASSTKLCVESDTPKKSATKNAVSRKKIEELKDVVNLAKHQLSVATNWSKRTIQKLENPEFSSSEIDLMKECEKVKWFLSTVSSNLIEMCNKIENFEKKLSSSNEEPTNISPSLEPSDNSCSSNLLAFLGLMSNIVKSFKGEELSLQNLLNRGKNFSVIKKNTQFNLNGIVNNSSEEAGKNEKITENILSKEVNDVLKHVDEKDDEKEKDEQQTTEKKSPCRSSSERVNQLVVDLKETNLRDNIENILSILENV